MTSLVWLRRDLRLHDHAALATALNDSPPVQPVFIFDKQILERFKNPDDRRLSFIAETLCHLDAELQKKGGWLMVLHGKAESLIPQLVEALSCKAVYSAEDFEPATRARDAAVKKHLGHRARFVQVLDHLLHPPQQVVKGDGSPYKVFTPYYKIWRSRVGPETLAEYKVKDKGRYANETSMAKAAQAHGLEPLVMGKGPAHLLEQIGYTYHQDPLWKVTEGSKRLKNFVQGRMKDYTKARDILAIDGTSELSPYLRHGLVSVRECMREALAAGQAEKWISELGWREFYASILYHFPEVVEHEFAPQYRGTVLPWSYDKKFQKAFEEGKTGYPVIDAAVRELLTTGYMHNRARMVVASFLTKDLFLDWRIGEEFFAQYLMDYELASNNGGWQWAASTGNDAAPYFRVFNPTLQSKKFDPKGEYIRRYVPELKKLSDKEIHAPWLMASPPKNYPAPIVDHAKAKAFAVTAFREAGNKKR